MNLEWMNKFSSISILESWKKLRNICFFKRKLISSYEKMVHIFENNFDFFSTKNGGVVENNAAITAHSVINFYDDHGDVMGV